MSKKGFNLLRPQIEPPTMWTRVYDWVVGSARIVVIVVELVVVVAFAIRIVIDVQSNNLNEEIKTKEQIVNTFQQAELRFIEVQNKTSAYKDLWEGTNAFSELFAEVVSFLPVSGQELVVQLNPDAGVLISGSAAVNDIGEMENKFKTSSTFTRQELDSIEGEGTVTQATFAFSARLSAPLKKQLVALTEQEVAPTITLESLTSPTPTFTPTLSPTP